MHIFKTKVNDDGNGISDKLTFGKNVAYETSELEIDPY